MSTHPSFVTLDLAALGERNAEVNAHLDACTTCRAYVERVQTPPDDLTLARVQKRMHARPSSQRWIYAVAALFLCALGVGLANTLGPRPDVVTSKGVPSVAVYVKRGDTVFLWNGSAPLKVGDVIRLRIVPEDAKRIVVTGQGSELYRGDLTPPETTLPVAWRLDEKGSEEHLRVGFYGREGTETFHVDLVLPKEAP